MLSRSTIFLGLMLTGTLALASLVREDASASSEVVLPTLRAPSPGPQDGDAAAYPTLQLEKLARSGLSDPEHNPFAGSKSWNVPSALPPLIPTLKDADKSPNEAGQSLKVVDQSLKEGEQPSTAPGVPFRYMGRIQEEGERPVVFFTQGSQAYAVSAGEEIDDSYRLESVSPTQLVLIYRPLKTKQTIDVSPLDMEPEEETHEGLADLNLTYHRELKAPGESQESGKNEL
jgi:hypothetical protein